MLITRFLALFTLLSLALVDSTIAQYIPTEIKTGWLKINTNLEQYFVVIDNDFDNAKLHNPGDTLEVHSGTREIKIVAENIDDYSFSILIPENIITEKRLNFTSLKLNPKSSFDVLFEKANVRISSDPNSQIYINGELAGKEQVSILLKEGKYDLYIITPDFGDLSKSFSVDNYSINTIHRFNKNPNPTSTFQKLIPGYSYVSNRQYGRAVFTYSGIALLTGTALFLNTEYNKKNDTFKILNEQYISATTSQQAVTYRTRARNVLNDMENLNNGITYSTLGVLVLYLATTIDGIMKPREGYKSTNRDRRTEFGFSNSIVHGSQITTLSFIVNL